LIDQADITTIGDNLKWLIRQILSLLYLYHLCTSLNTRITSIPIFALRDNVASG